MALTPSVPALRGETGRGRPPWYTHRLNHPAAYRVTGAVGAMLPRSLRLRLAAEVGARLRRFFPREWAVVEDNAARIRPGAGSAEHRALARAVFRHFAMCFTDRLVANRRAREAERMVAGVEGGEHLEAALAPERGVVLLTAHLGNWELAGRVGAAATRRRLHVVMEPEHDARVEALLGGADGAVSVVRRRRPTDALPLVAALRRHELVAMQGDRALGTPADARADFFGAPAAFPLGPFVLARATGAPVLPVFCVLERDRRYRLVLGAPVTVGQGGEREGLLGWVVALERMVRAHPEQWFNFFDCWRPGPAA